MHENEIIRLASGFGSYHPELRLGIGDDAAVIQPPGGKLVWTVDTLVENTHFLAGMPAAEIGWKALAVNLSDLAAMNARPLAALLSLSLPPETPAEWITGFFQGLQTACETYGVDLAGGDTVRSREIQISLSLLGQSPEPVTRYGAEPGDLLVVTGALGGAAGGLHCWQQSIDAPELLKRHWHPLPRFAEATALAALGQRLALLDTSDGLARSLQLLCEANRLGCRVEGRLIPIEPGLETYGSQDQIRAWALNGGEDYELLAAIAPEARAALLADGRFRIIGELTAAPAQRIVYADGSISLNQADWGFQHFKR